MKKTNELLNERETTHGDFLEVSTVAQSIKAAMRQAPNWEVIDPRMQEALDMIGNKIGRLLSGNPFFDDHSDDIAGYAELLRKAVKWNNS
jgi:hypothetical protein